MDTRNYQVIASDLALLRSVVKSDRYNSDDLLAILDHLVIDISYTFEKDNPRFSRKLFVAAVGIELTGGGSNHA